MVTQQDHDAATERTSGMLASIPHAIAARYDASTDRVIIDLSSGFALTIPRDRVQGIETATAEDLSDVEISPSGFGVRFPKVDADLWVPAMLQGIFGTKQWEAAWAAAHSSVQAA